MCSLYAKYYKEIKRHFAVTTNHLHTNFAWIIMFRLDSASDGIFFLNKVNSCSTHKRNVCLQNVSFYYEDERFTGEAAMFKIVEIKTTSLR